VARSADSISQMRASLIRLLMLMVAASSLLLGWVIWVVVGRALRGFSYVYALAMLVRWLISRTHGIPIAFHWMLAAYLFTLGGYYAGVGAAGSRLSLRRRGVSGGRTPHAAGR